MIIITWLLSNWRTVIVSLAVSIILSAGVGIYSYTSGYAQGRKDVKTELALANAKKKDKNHEILIHRADRDGVIKRLQSHTF